MRTYTKRSSTEQQTTHGRRAYQLSRRVEHEATGATTPPLAPADAARPALAGVMAATAVAAPAAQRQHEHDDQQSGAFYS